MKYWPFMFAASAKLDYRFVVRPDFLNAEQDTLFRSKLEMDGSDPSKVRVISFADSKNKTFYCWYRAYPITIGQEAQTDAAGRRLFCASGIITEELTDEASNRHLGKGLVDLEPFLKEKLVSFIGADQEWSPIVIPALDLDKALPQSLVAGKRLAETAPPPTVPVKPAKTFTAMVILSLVTSGLAILSLAASGWLFSKYSVLETQLVEIKTQLTGTIPKGASNPPAAANGPLSGSAALPEGASNIQPQPPSQTESSGLAGPEAPPNNQARPLGRNEATGPANPPGALPNGRMKPPGRNGPTGAGDPVEAPSSRPKPQGRSELPKDN
jgi:hypothetical protein